MTKAAVLKRVKEAYPDLFEELPRPKLRQVESAIIYAAGLPTADEILSETEHRKLMKQLTGTERLTAAQRLKAYRLRGDLTQVTLARRCGIPQANISAMEAGSRPIGILVAKRLARALGCDFRQLV